MSKRIVVITVYNSENVGSFLQAYAMQEVLTRRGWDVSFYKRETKGTTHAFWPHVLSVAKRVVQGKFSEIPFVWNPWFSFRRATKRFPLCTRESSFYQRAGMVLLGSDTVWNFDTPYFQNRAARYLGVTHRSKNVVAFAVSAANTAASRFHETVSRLGGLRHLSYICVRDTHTKELVEAEGQKAHLVTDPTLLLTKEDYLPLAEEPAVGEPYLLLYHFDRIEGELQQQIQQVARQKGWKVISLLHHRPWCDHSIPADPCKMIGYFQQAEAVVTDTFHGCAFSMIFEKPFAVCDRGKQKVQDLLQQYGEEGRLFAESSAMERLLDTPCTVMQNGTYERMREQAEERLTEALEA